MISPHEHTRINRLLQDEPHKPQAIAILMSILSSSIKSLYLNHPGPQGDSLYQLSRCALRISQLRQACLKIYPDHKMWTSDKLPDLLNAWNLRKGRCIEHQHILQCCESIIILAATNKDPDYPILRLLIQRLNFKCNAHLDGMEQNKDANETGGDVSLSNAAIRTPDEEGLTLKPDRGPISFP